MLAPLASYGVLREVLGWALLRRKSAINEWQTLYEELKEENAALREELKELRKQFTEHLQACTLTR